MAETPGPETPFEFEVDEAATESWELDEGDEIVPDRFALKKLGGGTDYEAYLAWDERLASVLVAKLLRPHLVEHPGALSGLQREAHALESLQHPSLVRGFGAVLDGPRPHLLMEHLEGPHLARLIRRFGALPPEQLVPLALNLFSVAHYLAVEQVVHLDIKPRNIVVWVPPRVIDLSVARTVKRASKVTGHVGTDLYMAPEQCEPNKYFKIGSPADVYGIGATLYHAAAGERPFERPIGYDREDLIERFPQLTHETPPLDPKKLPPALSHLITLCLSRNPDERPTAREAMDQLEPILAALPRKQRIGRLRPRLR
jgi:serine/threonine protein kinase